MAVTVTTAPSRSRGLALAVLCAATLMIILDGTIVTVALPSIQRAIGFSASGLTWVMNAYLIAFGGLLLLSGRLGDLAGRKRMFTAGMAVFTAASALCGVSATPSMLIAARFVQGIGGAMVSAVSLGMIVTLYPEPRERAKALGAYSFVGATDASAGSPHTLGPAAAAWLLLAAFVVRQVRTATPLLPFRIFFQRNVAGANLTQVLVISAAFGFQILITLYMQRVLGFSAGASGLGLVPVAAVIGAISLGFSARLNARFGERTVLQAGLALIVVALALLTKAPAGGGYAGHVLPALLLFGTGGGLVLPALAALGMSGATPNDAGVTSGLFNTTQQVGAALGIATLSTLAAARTDHLAAAGVGAAQALTGGYHLAFGVGASLGTVAVLLTATLLHPRAVVASRAGDAGPGEPTRRVTAPSRTGKSTADLR